MIQPSTYKISDVLRKPEKKLKKKKKTRMYSISSE